MAKTTTQLAVFLKNVPGALQELLRSLAEEEINIEGMMVNDAADHAVVRLVVDQPSKAIHLLGDRGAVVVESDILVHEMQNQPGEILALSAKLAKNRINIAYVYGSTPLGGGMPRVFLHTADDAKVMKLLRGAKAASGGRGSRKG